MGTRCNREVDLVRSYPVCDLFRSSLVETQIDLWVTVAKFSNDFWKDIASLRMRSRDRQCPVFFVVIIGRETANIFGFLHDQSGATDDLLAGRSNAVQALPFAHKQLQPEFFLEQFQLLADTGLRREQLLSSCRYIQTVVDDRKQVFQLL